HSPFTPFQNTGCEIAFAAFHCQSASLHRLRVLYPPAFTNSRNSRLVTMYLSMANAGTLICCASNSLSQPNMPLLRDNPKVAMPSGILIISFAGDCVFSGGMCGGQILEASGS